MPCDRIAELKKIEEEKQLLAQAKNEIESFVFDTQDKMEQDDFKLCSTDEERTVILAKMSEASDWLFDQEDTTPRKVSLFSCSAHSQCHFRAVMLAV